MQKQEFKRKDGSVGESYKLENGDVFVASFDSVGTRETLAVKDGKPMKILNHFLGIKFNDKELVVSITGGQKKVLDKETPLTGKTIEAVGYKNEFGEQVGVRVKK